MSARNPPIGLAATGRRDAGQATVFLVAAFGLLILVALVVSFIATRAVDRSVAANAADAAALSGAIGYDNPASIASLNGADTIELSRDADSVTATVRRGDMSASATAQRQGSDLIAAPALIAVVARIGQLAERAIAYEVLFPDPYATGSGSGPSLTISVGPEAVGIMIEFGPRVGLCRPEPHVSPEHFRLC